MNARSLEVLWHLEMCYEQDDVNYLKRLAAAQDQLQSSLAQLLILLIQNDFEAVQTLAHLILNETHDQNVYAFTLQFALASTEIKYDMKSRQDFLKRWQKLPLGSSQNSYVKFLQLFSRGVTCFFECQLAESEHLFEIAHGMSMQMIYSRGQMRSLFHLGLVARDRGYYEKSEAFFELARKIASATGSSRFLRRFEFGLESGSCASLEKDLMNLLRIKNWRLARATYLKLERTRRILKINRQAQSYYIYIGLIKWAQGKTGFYKKLLASIQDLVIKEKILSMKIELWGGTLEETSELEWLRLSLGHSRIKMGFFDETEIEIAGIKVNSIKSTDVQNFLKLLAKNRDKSITKEQICEKLWGYKYDPVAHDGRIYKLIHQARKLTQTPNLIENRYGSYILRLG